MLQDSAPCLGIFRVHFHNVIIALFSGVDLYHHLHPNFKSSSASMAFSCFSSSQLSFNFPGFVFFSVIMFKLSSIRFHNLWILCCFWEIVHVAMLTSTTCWMFFNIASANASEHVASICNMFKSRIQIIEIGRKYNCSF